MKLVLACAVAVLVSSSLALACKHETVGSPAITSAPVPVPLPASASASVTTAPLAASDVPAPPSTGIAGRSSLPPESPDGCLEVDSSFGGKAAVLSGTIYVDETFEHPARGRTRPFILKLDTPRCVLAAGEEEPRATEVHLAPTDGASLKSLVGKHVRVSGEPFVAHTAWHARGIVVLTGNVKPAS